jgi:hypothetical protein
MARSIECECTYSYTCGYCLRNAKPYFFTPSHTEVICADGSTELVGIEELEAAAGIFDALKASLKRCALCDTPMPTDYAHATCEGCIKQGKLL